MIEFWIFLVIDLIIYYPNDFKKPSSPYNHISPKFLLPLIKSENP